MSQTTTRKKRGKSPPDLPPINHVEAPPDHEFRDSEIDVQQVSDGTIRTRAGRKPRPPRTIISVKTRIDGKVNAVYSVTINASITQAMFAVQEIARQYGQYRHSDLQGVMRPKGVSK